jgi:hypothetical protein
MQLDRAGCPADLRRLRLELDRCLKSGSTPRSGVEPNNKRATRVEFAGYAE